MAQGRRSWTVEEIRSLVERKLSKRPCWFQIKIALALFQKKDVVGTAATGSGKTLSFWIALLMALEDGEDVLEFIITPLNVLGRQTIRDLESAGLKSIAVSKENACAKTFKDINDGKYHVVVINPEILMRSRHVEDLWKHTKFTSRIMCFIVDEGHCVSEWGGFRMEYPLLGNLRYLIPNTIPIYVASATMPLDVLHDVTETLHLRPRETEHITCSNDRPNIHLFVGEIKYSVSSYADLAFLIPDNFKDGDDPPEKFLVFFDNTKEAEAAVKYLRTRLPVSLREKVKWFHSTMTPSYRDEEFESLKIGNVWGLCVTDAFGMGLDLPDIKRVVQWKLKCNACTLWQRIGRIARGDGEEGVAIILVEKGDIDEYRQKKEAVRKKRQEARAGAKRKAKGQMGPPAKRPVLANRDINIQERVDEDDASDGGRGEEAEDIETVTGSLGALADIESHRARYTSRVQKDAKQKRGKNHGLERGGAIDDFVNAKTRGLPCRRDPLMIYFANDKINHKFHLLCDESNPDGCQRCRPKVARLCCDICNPHAFENLTAATVSKPAKAPAKSHIKRYSMTSSDTKLKCALLEWRQKQMVAKFGSLLARKYGAKYLLADDLVQRIVDCVHGSKITCMESIEKETHWNGAKEHGASLWAVINANADIPGPQEPRSDTQGVTSANEAPKKRRCGKCNGEGHIGSNRLCPVNVAHAQAARSRKPMADENTLLNQCKQTYPTMTPTQSRIEFSHYQIPPLPCPPNPLLPIPPVTFYGLNHHVAKE